MKDSYALKSLVQRSGRISLKAFFLAMGVVPLLVLWLSMSFYENHESERRNKASLNRLKKELMLIKKEGENFYYIQNRLNRVYGLLSEGEVNTQAYENGLRRLNDDGLGFLKVHFFDEKANLLDLNGTSNKYKSLISKVFKAISQPEIENSSSLLKKYKAFIENFLGEVDPGEVVYEKSSLLKVKIVGKPGYFYWNSFYDKSEGDKFAGGMIAYFLEKDLREDFALKFLINQSNQRMSNRGFMGVLDKNSKNSELREKLASSGFKIGIEELSGQIEIMRNRFESHSDIDEFVLAVNSLSAVRTLFKIEKNSLSDKKRNQFSFKLFSLCFLLFMSGFCFKHAGKEDKKTNAHIIKILMASAFLMPLMGLFIIGLQNQKTYVDLQIQANLQKLVSYIENVDENFNGAVYRLEKRYQDFSNSIGSINFEIDGDEKLKAFCKKNHVSQFFLVDKKGNFEFCYSENKGLLVFLEKFIPTLARKLFALKKGEKSSFKNQVNDMMVEKISENFSEFFSSGSGKSSFLKAFESFNEINEFWMANKRYYVFSSFVSRGKEKTPLLMFIWQGTTNLSQNYLKTELDKNLENNFKNQFVSLAMVPRKKDVMPFPPEFSKYSFVNRMMDKILDTNAQQIGVESISGENWLVAASPLKRIPEYVLFAVYPEKLVQEKIENNGFILLALFGLCFGLAAFCLKVYSKNNID